MILGTKTTNEFPVPDSNFRERDKLFRPMTPIHDVRGSSSFDFPTNHLMSESVEEIVLFG